MATATTKPRLGRVVENEDGEQEHRLLRPVADGCCDNHGVAARREEEVSKQRVSHLAVEGSVGASGGGRVVDRSLAKLVDDVAEAVHGRRSGAGVVGGGGRTVLPPPHAWLAVEHTTRKATSTKHCPIDDNQAEEQWARLLRSGGGGRPLHHQEQHRRSSFSASVLRRERAAREACLDRAWEMKRSWHERTHGGAPDADTPVVVVVGSSADDSHGHHHAGGGVSMDVDEVRACRDLGLELPADCTLEIQCYGLSGGSSPTHTAGSSGSGADSPGGVTSNYEADPTDVKARLKVWAQAVALASTTQLGS